MAAGAWLIWEVRDPQSNELVDDGIIVIDVLLEERIREPAQVSKYPAEKGVSRSDNHVPENVNISLDCLFLGNPTLKAIGGVRSQADIDKISGQGDMQAFQLLRDLKNSSVFLTYVTDRLGYNNLLIKDLDKVLNKDTGQDVCQIRIELEQQKLVTLKTATTEKPKNPAKNSVCQGKQNNGPKTGEPVTEEQNRTLGLQVTDYLNLTRGRGN